MLKRLRQVIEIEKLKATEDGIEAIIFTADGDMRYALNNLQATASGFDGLINRDNVFKVCDMPHPEVANNVIKHCLKGCFSKACAEVDTIYEEGYNPVDIIQSLTRTIQNTEEIRSDAVRLNFLKEASVIKMRTLEGSTSQLQLHGFLSKLCQLAIAPTTLN